ASAVPGSVWDRRRMEEAAMRLLDAEDPAELVSSLRYLFRAVLASGQDPSALLVSVLRRGKLELAREAAALIRDNLNRDLGRALDGLLSGEPSRMRDALHYLLHHAGRNWNEVLRAVTFPALATVLGREDRRSVLFPVLEQLVRLAPAEAERVEPFLDVLVDRLEDLDNHERFALSRFLLGLQEVYPEVAGYLLRRVQQTADPHLRAYYANVLSRLRLEAGQRTAVVEMVVDLVARHGQDVALQERLRVTCMNLGPQALERLSSETSLPGTQRVWLVHLWQACRTAGVELPSEDLFARFAWDELRARNRGALLALIRTGQLRHAGLAQRLAGGGPGAAGVLAYLLDEAYRLEDPDDQPVLDLLAAAGAEVLEPAFALVREEAALE
ncbi:MAG TPA: hypothetical protein VNO81_14215, partial [Candidatus Nitrosotenuis sp.]|nr:hypothetical protein [Candidatus Nitrosotenuis sp.]